MQQPAVKQLSFAEFARRTLFVLGLVVLGLLAWHLRSVLLFIFAGALLALVLRTLARPVARWTPIGTTAAVAVVLLCLLLVLAGAALLIGAQLSSQLGELWTRLPELLKGAQDFLSQSAIGRTIMQFGPQQFSGDVSAEGALSAAAMTFNVIGNVLLVVFVALFLAADPTLYKQGAILLVPPQHRDKAREVLSAIGRALHSWIVAQFASMVVIGFVTWVGLTLLGMPLALGLAFLAFLLEFIPVVGPIIAAVPAILVALSVSPMTALWVTLLYILIQQLEGYAVMPLLQRWAVRLPPALTLIAIVAFGLLFGWAGVLLATPLLVATIVLVRKTYVDSLEAQSSSKSK